MTLSRFAVSSFVLACLGLMSACVVAERDHYRDGYYDHEHSRYWHENSWHACGERDEHCH
jgi:hypothetical protein